MSQASPYFLSEPWGFLLSEASSEKSANLHLSFSGAGTPRVVYAAELAFEWAGGLGTPPPCGFPFRWNNKVFLSGHVPLSHKPLLPGETLRLTWRSRPEDAEQQVEQTQVLHRADDNSTTVAPEALRLGVLIDWMVHTFQELGFDALQVSDSRSGVLVRRSWEHARRLWLLPNAAEPRMELIIKMAQDAALLRAMESISRNPRRILLRKRENMPISRVKEMDAACIRHFARLPGHSAVQKAGSRQVLLAIQREASFTTLENKVACWTLDALRKRAEHWSRIHTRHSGTSLRAKQVRSLAKHSAIYRADPQLTDVSAAHLSHPVSANYPLILESRYRRVYRAYRELLRYERIKDDAWIWRRVLWSECVCQLVSCALQEIFPEKFQSAPHYRSEADRGRWTLSPCTPGPFSTAVGDAYLLDVHDEQAWHSDLLKKKAATTTDHILQTIGVLGADLVIWWPEKSVVIPVWSVLWTGPQDDWKAILSRAALALGRYALAFRHQGIGVHAPKGLVIGTCAYQSDFNIQTSEADAHNVIGIPFPMEIDPQDEAKFESLSVNLKAALELALEFRQ